MWFTECKALGIDRKLGKMRCATFQTAKRKNGRESAGLRELMSRRFGLPTVLPGVMYRIDLVKGRNTVILKPHKRRADNR